jgi:membrane associated rhomboid family serine protease
MSLSFPSYEEVKAHMEEKEREADEGKGIEIEPPTFVVSLILMVNAVIFLAIFFGENAADIFKSYGFIPASFVELNGIHTLLTHMFVHADFSHFLFNMLIFLSFAPQCEERMGKLRFLYFYLSSGIIASLFHFIFNISSEIPVVGASGAIFGVFAAFVALFPNKEMDFYVGFTKHKVPAVFAVALILFLEIILALISALFTFAPIAHLAHIGGFIGGLILVAIMYPKVAGEFLLVLLDAVIPSVPEGPKECCSF